MYRIKVFENEYCGQSFLGYFKCLYIASVHGERRTFIAWSRQDDYKTFKSKKAVENKLKFLHDKQNENYYIEGYGFEIEEVGD